MRFESLDFRRVAVLAAVACVVGLTARAAVSAELLAAKRTEYLRRLTPPQELPFDATRWIEACTNAADRTDFGKMEDLFDVRSALYSALNRLQHRPEPDAAAAAAVDRGYAALGRMDSEGAVAALGEAEARLKDSADWMPLTRYSPFGWVKNYAQWGYRRSPNGLTPAEPTPWNAEWQDGFRFSIVQDGRVAIDGECGAPRFASPMTDVRFRRDWTSDRWMFGDGTAVTFSLLTPVIDVEGTDTLTLGGFPSAPYRLRFIDPAGKSGFAPMSAAEVRIDPARIDRPWLMLTPRDDRWCVILLPGAKPCAVSLSGGIARIRFVRRSYVGILRAPGTLHSTERQALAEFFAGVTACPPESCREIAEGRVNGWRYAHRPRENDWGIAPHRIAPVPPLADYAGMRFAGSRQAMHPTRWNLFRFCEGDTASGTLPEGVRREPEGLRGVNMPFPCDAAGRDFLFTNGVRYVRLNRRGKGPLEEVCRELDAALGQCEAAGVRAVVDPHGLGYGVRWQNGMEPGAEEGFVRMWEALAKVGARHPAAVAGYDLCNEPGLIAGAEARWREVNGRAVAAIRANHPGAKVFYSAVYDANPNGLNNLEPLPTDCEPQAVTFHFYEPHAFTHQKMKTRNRGGDVCNFYPDWSTGAGPGGAHWGGDTLTWVDRWTLGALLLPAAEHCARHGVPLNVGEFGVIGYANGRSARSAFAWTRDAIELFGHLGASWTIWNAGFGLGNRAVREYVFGEK